jgi:hypothetical protein
MFGPVDVAALRRLVDADDLDGALRLVNAST